MNPTTWLLEGPAWVQYRARVDLLKQNENHPDVIAARKTMLADPQIKALIKSATKLPTTILTSHKSAGHPIRQLVFLADLGLRADDPGMKPIIARIFQHQSVEGPFQSLMNIPKHFGGSGKDEFAWALCDAPLLAYALARFGLGDDARVQRAIQHLVGLVRANGFPCAVSKELGKFRGPGRKDDPCPYANLVMLKLLGLSFRAKREIPPAEPRFLDTKTVSRNDKRAGLRRASRAAAETLLNVWAHSREQHPYVFYTGTDFRKLKAPLVWYDIVNVLDTLTQFPFLRKDARLIEMAECVRAQADADGRFTPESVWQAWGDWEFGQKKIPSRWLTLIARRALARLK
ncbi:MAG: hypothetical protein FJ009_20010 [Chloroflexi bacterium]|nr:hypothetical protein [Chloroflexota bacterium]